MEAGKVNGSGGKAGLRNQLRQRVFTAEQLEHLRMEEEIGAIEWEKTRRRWMLTAVAVGVVLFVVGWFAQAAYSRTQWPRLAERNWERYDEKGSILTMKVPNGRLYLLGIGTTNTSPTFASDCH